MRCSYERAAIAEKTMKVYNYNICKFDLFDTAVADVLRAIDGGSLMGSFILSFCCIDYMGMAINPSKAKNSSKEFKTFVTEYLGTANPKYKKLADHVWAVRNSLIHVYGQSDATARMNIGFNCTLEEPKQHLRIIRNPSDEIWLNLPDFVAELIAAIEHFFRLNQGNDKLFETWYSKLLILSGGTTAWLDRLDAIRANRPDHKRSHRLLEVLDEMPPSSLNRIVQEISKGICKRLGIK